MIKNLDIKMQMVRTRGLEPPHRKAPDPKSGVSANFTTSATVIKVCQAKSLTRWYAQEDSNLWPTA